jgi:hypothetical protein
VGELADGRVASAQFMLCLGSEGTGLSFCGRRTPIQIPCEATEYSPFAKNLSVREVA